MTLLKTVEWCLFIVVPVLAVYTAMWLYNAYVRSRRREILAERDAYHELEFTLWWESVNARRALIPAFCPMEIETGETCYAFEEQVARYEPRPSPAPADVATVVPPPAVEEASRPTFDVACGVKVPRNWSAFDGFGDLRFVDHYRLCVTDCRLCLRSRLENVEVALDEITSVVASCSAFVLTATSLQGPLLIGNVNGQKIRDTLHILKDENAPDAWK